MLSWVFSRTTYRTGGLRRIQAKVTRARKKTGAWILISRSTEEILPSLMPEERIILPKPPMSSADPLHIKVLGRQLAFASKQGKFPPPASIQDKTPSRSGAAWHGGVAETASFKIRPSPSETEMGEWIAKGEGLPKRVSHSRPQAKERICGLSREVRECCCMWFIPVWVVMNE
jgi:hypothetical protein